MCEKGYNCIGLKVNSPINVIIKKGTKIMKITAETTIADIVYNYPELVEPLHKLGLYCFS